MAMAMARMQNEYMVPEFAVMCNAVMKWIGKNRTKKMRAQEEEERERERHRNTANEASE